MSHVRKAIICEKSLLGGVVPPFDCFAGSMLISGSFSIAIAANWEQFERSQRLTARDSAHPDITYDCCQSEGNPNTFTISRIILVRLRYIQ